MENLDWPISQGTKAAPIVGNQTAIGGRNRTDASGNRRFPAVHVARSVKMLAMDKLGEGTGV